MAKVHLYSLCHTWLNLRRLSDRQTAISYQASLIITAASQYSDTVTYGGGGGGYTLSWPLTFIGGGGHQRPTAINYHNPTLPLHDHKRMPDSPAHTPEHMESHPHHHWDTKYRPLLRPPQQLHTAFSIALDLQNRWPRKRPKKCGNTGSPCLDKPMFGQRGGGYSLSTSGAMARPCVGRHLCPRPGPRPECLRVKPTAPPPPPPV